MSDREALIDAFSDVNFSEWSEVQSFVEGAVADAILSSDWLTAHDAEKRAEWEAEQGQTEWEYGVSREVATPMSSREAAERQIERMAKSPKGYRLTANLVRRRVTPWVAAPDTTNNESEGKA